MTFSLLLYCVAAVALVLLGVLFRTGRYPSLAGESRRGLANMVSSWTFVAAGIAGLLAVAALVERAHPGEPGIYLIVRWVLIAALAGVGVRVFLLLR